ncbi:MAG: type II secretion system protein [Acidobacteria bacterium]|nr:type II secretion system protein [Acidobacteriota bacterium]
MQLLRRRKTQAGLTLIELIVAFTILIMLTAMSVPLARYKVRRDKERDLRIALAEMRRAIDSYKDAVDKGEIGPVKVETDGYPETLEMLVEGVKKSGQVDKKVKFLRRIPKDPFTNSTDWGKRSWQDDPKSTSWGGQNVFDVFTKSTERGRDGTLYSEW